MCSIISQQSTSSDWSFVVVGSDWYATSIAGIARAERRRSLFVHRVRLAVLSTLHETVHTYIVYSYISTLLH